MFNCVILIWSCGLYGISIFHREHGDWWLTRNAHTKEYPVWGNILINGVACVFYDRKSSELSHPIIVLNVENFTSTDCHFQKIWYAMVLGPKVHFRHPFCDKKWNSKLTVLPYKLQKSFSEKLHQIEAEITFFAENFLSKWFGSNRESCVAQCDEKKY